MSPSSLEDHAKIGVPAGGALPTLGASPQEALHDAERTKDPWSATDKVKASYERKVLKLTETLEKNPNDATSYGIRSDAYLYLKQPAKAFADADQACRLEPSLGWLYGNRGEARLQQKQYGEALVDLDKGLKLSPKNSEIVYFRAMALDKLGLTNLAVKEYENARKMGFIPGGVDKDVDFGPYMAEVQRTLKRNWFPPKGEESKRVVVFFHVRPDGAIDGLKLTKSSGSEAVDQAAMQAVQKSSSLSPLPAGVKYPVDIEFTFDYNVFNGDNKKLFRPF